MQEYSGGTRHKKGEKMRLEFSIVLFENEGYATARRNTGINEILASKAGDTGYVMDDDSYRIFTLDPYAWKWWLNPRLHRPDFCSCYSSSTESDCDNPAIQERIIKALEDWQKKYLRANETIKLISSGKHILYHCDVETVCGDAEIYCFDSVIDTMEDHAQAEIITGNSFIKNVQGNAQIQCLDDHAMISNLCENAVVHKMKDISLIRHAYKDSQIHTMQDNSRILSLNGNARLGTMNGHTIVDLASGQSVIEKVSCGCAVLGLSHDAQIKKVESGATVLPLHVDGYHGSTMPFS